MRVTIKLKLAMAFGLVLLLSMISGAVAISQLSALNDTLDGVVNGPAKRSLEAADFKIALLQDLRAEKNMVMSTSDEDKARFTVELMKNRTETQNILQVPKSTATETGRRMLNDVGALMEKQVEFQDRTVQDAKLNSTNVINALINNEGRPRPAARPHGPMKASAPVTRKVQGGTPARGFALALSEGGSDEHDREFERY